MAQSAVKILAVVLAVILTILAAALGAAAARDRHARKMTITALVIQSVVVVIAGLALGWALFGGTLLVLGTLLYALLDEQPHPAHR
jgi:hypothetical protein